MILAQLRNNENKALEDPSGELYVLESWEFVIDAGFSFEVFLLLNTVCQ